MKKTKNYYYVVIALKFIFLTNISFGQEFDKWAWNQELKAHTYKQKIKNVYNGNAYYTWIAKKINPILLTKSTEGKLMVESDNSWLWTNNNKSQAFRLELKIAFDNPDKRIKPHTKRDIKLKLETGKWLNDQEYKTKIYKEKIKNVYKGIRFVEIGDTEEKIKKGEMDIFEVIIIISQYEWILKEINPSLLPKSTNGKWKIYSDKLWVKTNENKTKAWSITLKIELKRLAQNFDDPNLVDKPILYVYSKEQINMDVKAIVPKGMITQWWPAGENNLTLLSDGINTTSKGKINWKNIKVLPYGEKTYLKKTNIKHQPWWHLARETDSCILQNKYVNLKNNNIENQNEKFLFYRGQGRYTKPIKVKLSDNENKLEIIKQKGKKSHNLSDLLVIKIKNGKALGHKINMKNVDKVNVDLTMTEANYYSVKHFKNKYKAIFKQMVYEDGLYEKEAEGMAEIWHETYFATDGIRVIYLLPKNTIDELIPLDIKYYKKDNKSKTKLANVERTIAVRLELMNKYNEKYVKQLIHQLKNGNKQVKNLAKKQLLNLDRFHMAILRRELKKFKNLSNPFIDEIRNIDKIYRKNNNPKKS